LSYSEAIGRTFLARRHRARRIARAVEAHNLDGVLHTGSLDLPPEADGADHYLYCDQTWNLSLRHRPDRADYTEIACAEFDELERASYAATRHIFTFADYVRNDLIDHYGVPSNRVTVVGSGMGQVVPYEGSKDYTHGPLLFVAKHLFRAKGGALVLEAFRRVRALRPDLRLIVVAPGAPTDVAREIGNVTVYRHLEWPALEHLFRSAALLVQPMLNDPWGQVYLEALLSRTPVLGLARNGLPEIVEGGRHGFLIDEPEPTTLADGIINAMSDPDRLECMGASGQERVRRAYSWDMTCQRIAAVLARHRIATRSQGVPIP
jgi:glycosyltransferase involved in cell wall biosynthesis